MLGAVFLGWVVFEVVGVVVLMSVEGLLSWWFLWVLFVVFWLRF